MSSFYLPAGVSQEDLDLLIARSPEEYYYEDRETYHCPRCGIITHSPRICNPCWGEILSDNEGKFNLC
jgi:hypothetical protein